MGRIVPFGRFASSGPLSPDEIAFLVSVYKLAALFDTYIAPSVTLNGGDVSALADLSGNGYHLAQAAPGNQPLYTGAPAYNGWPSIQFTAANLDSLYRANTNIKAANDTTIVTVQKSVGGSNAAIISNEFSSTVLGCAAEYTVGTLRGYHESAVTNYGGGTHSTTAPEVWVWTKAHASSNPALRVNNVPTTISSSGAQVGSNPGATADLCLGRFHHTAGNALSMDFMFAAWFQCVVPDDIAIILSKRLMTRAGL